MARLIANTRGSLGAQLACYLAIRAFGAVGTIYHNIGGKINPASRHCYLQDLLADCPPVKYVEGNGKADLTRIPVIMNVVRQAQRVKLSQPITPSGEAILHVRAGDRQTASDEAYIDSVSEFPAILGNYADSHLVDMLGVDKLQSDEDPVTDWFRIVNAARVRSSVTWFTLTAAMVNPEMKLEILPADGPKQMPPRARPAADYLIDHLPNVTRVSP